MSGAGSASRQDRHRRNHPGELDPGGVVGRAVQATSTGLGRTTMSRSICKGRSRFRNSTSRWWMRTTATCWRFGTPGGGPWRGMFPSSATSTQSYPGHADRSHGGSPFRLHASGMSPGRTTPTQRFRDQGVLRAEPSSYAFVFGLVLLGEASSGGTASGPRSVR